MGKVKQVLIVRKDLKMRKGKIASQSAHASLGAVFQKSFVQDMRIVDKYYVDELTEDEVENAKCIPMEPDLEHWFNEEFTKICVCVNSEEELVELETKAKDLGLRHFLVTDAGHTEFNGVPTRTVLAIGPCKAEDVDPLTKDLKLL